eukprot:jgi/Galph1/2448/GphlegSOOS_G1090.1
MKFLHSVLALVVLVELVKGVFSQSNSLAVTNVEENGKLLTCSHLERHSPETQTHVEKVLLDARRREEQALSEVLQEKVEEAGSSFVEDVAHLHGSELAFEEPLEEQQELDTVAKLFQWSIVASSKGKNISLKLSTQEIRRELVETEIEDRISFIRYATKFFHKARTAVGWKPSTRTSTTKSVWTLATEEEALSVAIRKLVESKLDSDKVQALETLSELAHKMENAKNILALGGIVRIIGLLQEPCVNIRSMALYTLAICAQNNDVVQAYLIHHNLLNTLVEIAKDDDVSVVRTRALLAISTLLDAKEGKESLEQVSGIEDALVIAIQDTSDVRCIRRAFNLASELISLDKFQWKIRLNRSPIKDLAKFYLEQHENIDVRESAACLLTQL